MDTNIYSVDIKILLEPIGNPKCIITLDDYRQDIVIDHEQWAQIKYTGQGAKILSIEHYGKLDNDPSTALIIKEIVFDNISDYKFIYQGIYYPRYPKHLIENNKQLPHESYMSWNGVWRLEFTLPIYTWIHKTLDLGWIYD